MKQFFLCLAFAAALAACSYTPLVDEDTEEGGSQENAIDTTLVFSCFKDSFSVNLDIKSDWTMSVSPSASSWCHCSPESGRAGLVAICIKTDENGTDSIRNALVTIRTGNSAFTFAIWQEAREAWLNSNWWDRTDRQKACIYGAVETVVLKGNEPRRTRYDRSGNCLEDTLLTLSGKTVMTWKHEYDLSGRRTGTLWMPSTDTPCRLTYRYDNGDALVPTSYKCWTGDTTASNGLPMTILRGLSGIELRNDMGDYTGCIDYTYTFISPDSLLITHDIWKEYRNGSGTDDGHKKEEHVVLYRDGYPYQSETVSFVYYYDNGMFREYVDTTLLKQRRMYYETDNRLALHHVEELSVQDVSSVRNYTYIYLDNWDIVEIKGYLMTGDLVQDIKYTDYDYDTRNRSWISRIVADVLSPDRGWNAVNESRTFTFFK